MLGFAGKQFCQQEIEPISSRDPKFLFEEYALPIDIRAAFHLSNGRDLVEETKTLLAFIFAAARHGHLCVEIGKVLNPKVKSVWLLDDDETAHLLEEKILKGFQLLKPSFFEENPSLVKKGERLYLQKNWMYESEIEQYFYQLEKDSPAFSLSSQIDEASLTDEQSQAIKKSMKHCLSFIAGGPGVGKTYTASFLIKAFIWQFPEAKVAIVAPTGKAVANLQQYLARSLKAVDTKIEAFTLHKLFYQKIDSFLPYDLILVDESSMVDAHFMLQLLKYYKPKSRLIFLGDPNQLPPVGSGFVFSDLMNMSSICTKLTKCLRTDIQEIIESAEAVRKGRDLSFIEKIQTQNSFFILDKKEDFLERIEKQIPKESKNHSLYEKLKTSQTYKVLSPMRQGTFGVENINQMIKKLRPKNALHPIMIVSNDYQLELFNGDIGLLTQDNEAIFFSRHSSESYLDIKENVRRIPFSRLPPYELAYCISIHKSQGSEYEKVSIVIPPQSEVFSRELLYTAITRAKKGFEIFSTKHTLSELIRNQNARLSGLSIKEKK